MKMEKMPEARGLAESPSENKSRKKWGKQRVVGIFATGLLTILPLGGTILILSLLATFAYEWAGPSSKLGSLLVLIGVGGGEREILRYLVGIGFAGALIFGIGILAELGLRRGIREAVDGLMRRLPVAKNVYETLANFIALLSKNDKGAMGGMSPVWCRFGGQKEVVVLGLLSSPRALQIGGRSFFAVVVPTAPVPFGGGLFFMETDRVQAAEGIGIEGLTSIYVSMGVTAPQFIKHG